MEGRNVEVGGKPPGGSVILQAHTKKHMYLGKIPKVTVADRE